jgi:hypothetical protein
MIKIYYGLSGTFKGTTIKYILNNNPDVAVIWSMIKPWKRLETGIYNGMITYNDLNYALSHLTLLEYVLSTTDKKDILVERGVSDMTFYRMLAYERMGETIDDSWIRKSVEEELRICGDQSVHKTLLIQKDEDFIRDVILSEPTRAEKFPNGLSDYLRSQDEYIKFTEKYNSISEVITINNAKSYLENLGIEYNEELCKKS